MVTAKSIFKKYRRTFTNIGRSLAIILSLLLVLFCNMFKAINEENFNFKAEFVKNLKSPLTWGLAIAVSIAWVVVYINAYQISKEKKIKENAEVFEEYKVKNNSKPNNFRDYINKVENVHRKEKAYIAKMEYELAKVQSAMESIPMEKHNSKKYKKLKEKEADIIFRSTPEYIKEHFLSLSVKYNRVTLEHFTFAFTTGKLTDQTDSKEKNKFASKVFSRIVSGVFISICGVSILGSLQGMFEWKDGVLWITLGTIIMSIILQVYCAMADADAIVDSEIIAPTITKIKIIDDSLLWAEADMTHKPLEMLVKQHIENTRPKEEIQDDEAEITLEQLEYIKRHEKEINEAIAKEESDNSKEK